MTEFHIAVRNEFTGEVRVVHVVAEHQVDAQIEALHFLFHQEGWNKATALIPHSAAEAA